MEEYKTEAEAEAVLKIKKDRIELLGYVSDIWCPLAGRDCHPKCPAYVEPYMYRHQDIYNEDNQLWRVSGGYCSSPILMQV